MSEEFPTKNAQPNQVNEWLVEDPQITSNGVTGENKEQVDIGRAAEITRDHLVRDAENTTQSAFMDNFPEERIEESSTKIDAPVDDSSFVTEETRERGKGSITLKSSHIDGQNSSTTFEESVPTGILGRPKWDKRRHERTSTVTTDRKGKGIPSRIAGENFEGAEAVYEEEVDGKYSGRKISRRVTVGKDEEGGPVVRVELNSHGPEGPEDNPRTKVIGYGEGALLDKNGNPLKGSESGEQQEKAALKTAEAVSKRVAKAQPIDTDRPSAGIQ